MMYFRHHLKYLNALLLMLCCIFNLAISDTPVATLPKPVLIDVRTEAEFKAGYLNNAINIDVKDIEAQILITVPDKNTPINLYCRSGNRSGIAKITLEKMGYTKVTNLGAYDHLKTQFNKPPVDK